MGFIFREFDKYSIRGKIIDINDSSTLTISVTSPFVGEFEFYCSSEYYNMLYPPAFKYYWISWVGDSEHPSVTEASAYYNTTHKCFYTKESGRESEWELTDFEDIYDDNPHLLTNNMNMQEKYKLFLYKYKPTWHKGQICRFSAYAIDRDKSNLNWYSIHNKQVERHPGDYTWIYDPDSFLAEKWDAESIDNLVKEIRPSKDYLEQLLASYKADEQEAKRKTEKEKWERRWKAIISAPERFQNWLTKYDKIWILLTGSVGALIVKLIIDYFRSN